MCRYISTQNLPGHASGKESACQCRSFKRLGFDPWVRKIPWSRTQQPTLVPLPGETHGWKRLVGYSPWHHKESDTTERLSTHTLKCSKLCPFLTPYPPPPHLHTTIDFSNTNSIVVSRGKKNIINDILLLYNLIIACF